MNPEVSILMPVYNGAKFLKIAVDSILSQTFTDYELIIVNDGSTDNSFEIINSYKEARIKTIDLKTNLGIVRALNAGLNVSVGNYIARMDSDDICLPTRIEKQVNFMKLNPEMVLCGTNIKTYPVDKDIENWITNLDPIQNHIRLLFNNIIAHPTAMMDGNKLRANNFLYSEKHIYCEDYKLWTQFADLGQISNLTEPLLIYRIHEESLSQKKRDIQKDITKDLIRELLKDWLELEASDEQLIIHLCFGGYLTFKTDSASLKAAKEWLRILKSQNRKKQKWPVKIFDDYIEILSKSIPEFSWIHKLKKFLIPLFG